MPDIRHLCCTAAVPSFDVKPLIAPPRFFPLLIPHRFYTAGLPSLPTSMCLHPGPSSDHSPSTLLRYAHISCINHCSRRPCALRLTRLYPFVVPTTASSSPCRLYFDTKRPSRLSNLQPLSYAGNLCASFPSWRFPDPLKLVLT